MQIYSSPKQVAVAVVMLALVLGWMGWVTLEKRALGRTLATLGEGKARALLQGTDPATVDRVLLVENDKSFGFLGKDLGRVNILLRDKGDISMKSFRGFEVFYQGEAGAWVEQDFASMPDPATWEACYDAFRAHGFTVDEAAYTALAARIQR